MHTSAITQAELDRVLGPGCWAYQAEKLPDANDGDVVLLPFMKRHLSDLGERLARSRLASSPRGRT